MENNDNTTPLVEAAIHIHELYLSFIQGGFTKEESLYLVSQSLRPQGKL